MNSILERVVTPKEAVTLERSVKHYNNFSPMFRGPLNSNTLLSISKNWLNNKLLTQNSKKFKSFLKGTLSARKSIRKRLGRPQRNERVFSSGNTLDEIPQIRTARSPLNQKEGASQRKTPSWMATMINLPTWDSDISKGKTPKNTQYEEPEVIITEK